MLVLTLERSKHEHILMQGMVFELAWAVLSGTDHARFPRLHFDAVDGCLKSPSAFVIVCRTRAHHLAAPRC